MVDGQWLMTDAFDLSDLSHTPKLLYGFSWRLGD